MSAFTRIAIFAALVLSLSYLVSALPASVINDTIPVITGADPVSLACAKYLIDVEIKLKALLGCNSILELKIAVGVLVALLKACAGDLLNTGAGVAVSDEAQASIVACFAATITLLVKVCVAVSVKFGPTVVLVLFTEIDAALRLCLLHLNICVGGILVLIAKAIASVTVGVMAQVHLKLCLSILGLAGVSL
ncbi:hypothetical protein BDV93DRAFT_562407 [Ceratobasidium sp. AG-I]|nr:hypothetical protein BDV93DRAFT_562407 [Ceratobasidium sp. AG-I]